MKLLRVSARWGIKLKKYLQHIFIVFCTLVVCTISSFAQEDVTLTEEELQWIKNHPYLKATNDMGWAPIDYVRAGRPAGFSVDYLKLVASKVGFSINFVNGYTWTELMTLARNKEIDIVHAVVDDQSKREFLSFTAPYMDLKVSIYAREGAMRINDISDLEGRVIAVIDGFGVTEKLREEHPGLDYKVYSLAADALSDVAVGNADLFFGIMPAANYAITSNFIEGLEIIGQASDLNFGKNATIHLATHVDNGILFQILEKGMALVTEEELLALEEKWQSVREVSGDLELTAEETAWIAANPLIRVTNEMDWAPIDFTKDGEAMGFSVDYFNLLASKIGISVEYVNGYTWEELVELLKNGEIDVAPSITQTKNRENFLDFTTPYLDLPKVYVARTGSKPIRDEYDLYDRRIGLIRGWSSSEQFRSKFPELEYTYYDDVKDALYGLASGDIDVFSERLPVVNYIIAKNFIPRLEVIGTELHPEINGQNYLRIGTRKDLPVLHQLIEKAMSSVTDEEFSKVSEKWRSDFYSQNDIGLTIDEIQWLAEHNVVKVLVDPTLAPYEFLDDGIVSGISGAYLDKIAKKLNIRIEWAGNSSWNEGFKMFTQGDAHIVSGIVPTPEREQNFIFTDAYMQSTSAIFTREGGQFFVNMDGLDGYKIAQEQGYALTEFIRRDYPNIEIVEVSTIGEALQLVLDGTVDAHVGDIPTVAYQIATGNLPIIVAGETPYTKDTAYGVHPNLPHLASAMQKALRSIDYEERTEITSKWLAIKFENNINRELIMKIVSFGSLFLVLVLIWAISLRREINRRRVIEGQLLLAQKQAEAANEAKSTFLANMSHEIRTPLNAIIGFSEIMSQNLFGKISPPRYKEYLEDIEASGRHLANVINDILDLSKIEAGKWELDIKRFNLDECLQSALKMIETHANSKQVRLFYSKLPKNAAAELMGDEVAFRRVLINILSNAVKFTENGGLVSCTISKGESGEAVIKICDTGVGIPADKLEHVLTPFGQNADSQHMIASGTGTGLGLSIVKDLVELHGGVFKLNSEEGVGTEAVITMPEDKVVLLYGLENAEEITPLKSVSA